MTIATANDHAGLLVILDRTGRTIALLEDRVDDLTAQVAQVTVERDQLAHLYAEARAAMADARDVPPSTGEGGDNEPHDPPRPPD